MLRTIERIARAIPKSAIEIVAITLLIAAIWYAFEISTFSSLSESQARFWLRISEWLIFGSALVLAIGLILEWPESESWKRMLVYKAAKWSVLIGVAGELLGDGGVFQAGDRVTELQDRTITQLLTHRTLSQDQKDRLVSVAKKFPARNFQTLTVGDNESWGLAMEIADVLQINGWNWLPCEGQRLKLIPADGRPSSCWMIVEGIQVDGAESMAPVVASLVAALKDPNVIGMDNARGEVSAAYTTVAIMVGSKR